VLKGRMEYRRQVAMRCDGEDFVIALQPEDEVVFRTKDARALRDLSAGFGGRSPSTRLFRRTIGPGRRKQAAAGVRRAKRWLSVEPLIIVWG